MKGVVTQMIHPLVGLIKRLAKTVLRNRWIFRLIGLGLFITILLRVDLRSALKTLAQVDPWYILLSLIIQFAALAVATSRWQIIMRRFGIQIPFRRSFIHQLIGTSAALITPGQLGEFVKVLYHRKEGFPVPESVLSVALDRLSDLILLLIFGCISLTVLIGMPPVLWICLAIAGVALLVGFFLFFRDKAKGSIWIENLLVRLSPKTYKESVQQSSRRLVTKVLQLDRRFFLSVGLLSFGNFLLLLIRVYAIILAIHMVVPFWYFAMVVPILRLVGLIPVSILGIGTRDVTSIYLYGRIGIPASTALVSSTLGLLMLQVQTLVGLIAGWRYPLGDKKGSVPGTPRLPDDGVISVKKEV